jgi:hypothetical protein
MAAARLQRARADGATVYATEILMEAETALQEAEEALSESGNQREAIEAAARACLRADAARRKAREEKSRIHRMADRLIKECQALIEEAHSKNPGSTEREELDSHTASVDAIQKLLSEERLSEAQDSAQSLKRKLLVLLERLDEDKR